MRKYATGIQTYLKLGWPVLALIAMIATAGFVLLQNVAREQDKSYETSSQDLMLQSIQTMVLSNAQVVREYGIWSDAYKNITMSNNKTWMDSNYYSSISSAIVVVRPETGIRYLYVEDDFKACDVYVRAFAQNIDFSPHHHYQKTKLEANLITAPLGLVLIHNQLAVVAAEPIRPDKYSGDLKPSLSLPIDYVVSIRFLDTALISKIGQALSLKQTTMIVGAQAPAAHKDKVHLAIKDISGKPVAWVQWSHLRPGSAAFARRMPPIGLGLIILGLYAIYVTQTIVSRQMKLLELARLAAEDGSKAKSSFLASMSHELRTPLNAIIGYSEIITEDCLDMNNQVGASDAKKVTRSAHHLLALINDLLDHSKIEAGKMDLNPTYQVLSPIVDDVVEVLRLRATENRSVIHMACDPLLGDGILDGMRLKQCLLNLVSNAVKFTRDGTITVAARPVEIDGEACIRFSVKDTGIGMSAETVSKLFIPFVQADETTAQKYGGTGLGLVITQSLINAMGGSISVESVEGEGSCFTLIVPRGRTWSIETTPCEPTAIAA